MWKTNSNELSIAPNTHPSWIKIIPTERHNSRRQIRSMLWIRKDITYEQIPIASPEMTVAILQLPERNTLMASENIPPADKEILKKALNLLQNSIDERRKNGPKLSLIIMGDFNPLKRFRTLYSHAKPDPKVYFDITILYF